MRYASVCRIFVISEWVSLYCQSSSFCSSVSTFKPCGIQRQFFSFKLVFRVVGCYILYWVQLTRKQFFKNFTRIILLSSSTTTYHIFCGKSREINSNNRPDIQRCGKAENKAGKQDTRRRKLKLSMLSVVKVSSAYLYKEQNCEYHIAHGKDHIINNSLNLTLGCVPGILNSSRHIARREYGYRKYGQNRRRKQKHEKDFAVFLIIFLPPITFIISSSAIFRTRILRFLQNCISFCIPLVTVSPNIHISSLSHKAQVLPIYPFPVPPALRRQGTRGKMRHDRAVPHLSAYSVYCLTFWFFFRISAERSADIHALHHSSSSFRDLIRIMPRI